MSRLWDEMHEDWDCINDAYKADVFDPKEVRSALDFLRRADQDRNILLWDFSEAAEKVINWLMIASGANGVAAEQWQPLFDDVRELHRCSARIRSYVLGCEYVPDDLGFTWVDSKGDEHYEEDSASENCGSASCSNCGYSMVSGEEGWFDGWDEPIEWFEEGSEEHHRGYVLRPRFNYCPNCGRPVIGR